jgi:uncharacterized membrane protein
MPEVDKTIEEGKMWGFIGYWGILFLIPLLGKKDNKFAVFHGKQGMVVFLGLVIIIIASTILGFIPVIGAIFSILAWLVYLALVVLAIIGMIKSLQGEYWKMPVLGDIAEKINI